MHVGLVMECDYREGRTQEEAFAEAMSIAEIAETQGLDGVWLAERHFAIHRRPTDPMGAGIPSIASVPLVLAAAIAARTRRLRIGTGVSVLPLCHPLRTAGATATSTSAFPSTWRPRRPRPVRSRRRARCAPIAGWPRTWPPRSGRPGRRARKSAPSARAASPR